MNTKKFLFALAAFGMLAAVTYTPNYTSDKTHGSTSIEKATAKTPENARK